MLRIGIGVVAVILLALAGYFGFEHYVEQRVAGAIETAFEQVRATGGKASHGRVSFNLLKRAISVADLAVESASQPPLNLTAARFAASAVSLVDPTRFSAGQIEVSDLTVTGSMSGHALHLAAPDLVATDFSSPAGPARPADAGNPIRSAFEQFAAITAGSVTAPELIMTYGLPDIGGVESFQYHYSDVVLHDIKGGKIASATADKASVTGSIQQFGKTEPISGEFAGSAAYDIDVDAIGALFDPARASDSRVIRAYRQGTLGAYTAMLPTGVKMHVDGATFDDIGVRPAKAQISRLMAMIAAMPAQPTPAQVREMIEIAASLYEGVRIGNAEMRGLAIDLPQGAFRLGAIRFNLDNGKIGEFALEGVDVSSPQGQLKLARYALQSVDVANLLRRLPQFSNPAQKPPPEQLFGLLQLLGGATLDGMVMSYKDRTEPVSIDHLSLNWGQFVGVIPSQARLSLKMSTPLDGTDSLQQMLLAAGLRSAAVNAELGAAWMEGPRSLVLDPVVFDLGRVLSASGRLALTNVPRELFSKPQLAAQLAGQLGVGAIELTLRDTGGVDLAVAQLARIQNLSPEAARHALTETIRSQGRKFAASNPDTAAIADALAHFFEASGGTLTLRLNPKGLVPALPLLAIVKSDPLIALSEFKVEASTAR